MKIKTRILPSVILILSLWVTVGVKLIFHACAEHDDGSFGACHWAEQAVFAIGIITSVGGIMLLIFSEYHAQMALSIIIGCSTIISALIPGGFISTCVMPSMACNASMTPWVRATGFIIAICCLVNILVARAQYRKEV